MPDSNLDQDTDKPFLGLSVVLLLLSRWVPRKDFKSGNDQFIVKK